MKIKIEKGEIGRSVVSPFSQLQANLQSLHSEIVLLALLILIVVLAVLLVLTILLVLVVVLLIVILHFKLRFFAKFLANS